VHYKSAKIHRYPLYSADFPLNQSIERSVTSFRFMEKYSVH
jgi:hypothetical protein